MNQKIKQSKQKHFNGSHMNNTLESGLCFACGFYQRKKRNNRVPPPPPPQKKKKQKKKKETCMKKIKNKNLEIFDVRSLDHII